MTQPLQATDSAPVAAVDGPALHILYEHPDWFRPLFAELDRRGIAYRPTHASEATWDPATAPSGAVLFNRMSPSAWTRGDAATVFATADVLARAEAAGIHVVNGSHAWAVEISKARQLDLLAHAGVQAPRSRVVHHGPTALAAARHLTFPIVSKPNVGGSGAGVTPFDTLRDLEAAVDDGRLDLGLTGVGLLQERFQSADGAIHRVEVLGGRVLYGIRVHAPEDEFNLCPADACQTADGAELARGACAVDAADQGLKVEAFEPSPHVIAEVERIAHLAQIDVGGIEYVIDADSGVRLYYDVNALSNFVADGPRVIGFDPFERLVDWLQETGLPAASHGGGR